MPIIPWRDIHFETTQDGSAKQKFKTLFFISGKTITEPTLYSSVKDFEKALKKQDVAVAHDDKTKSNRTEPATTSTQSVKIEDLSAYKVLTGFYANNPKGACYIMEVPASLTDEGVSILKKYLVDTPFHAIGITFKDVSFTTKIKEIVEGWWGQGRAYKGFIAITEQPGQEYNSQYICQFPDLKEDLYWIPQILGVITREGENDPAVPLTNLKIADRSPKKTEYEQLSWAERDKLAEKRTSTLIKDLSGDIYIETVLTTKKTTVAGDEDNSYLYLNKLLSASFMANDLYLYLGLNYQRYRIADDGNSFYPHIKVTSPLLLKADVANNKIKEWGKLGLIDNAEKFIEKFQVYRDPQNKRAIKMIIPEELISPLLGIDITFNFIG